MKKNVRRAILGSLLVCCIPVVAQEKGNWRPVSSTAQSITGEIALSDQKITINLSSFPMARIRSLEKAEITAAFDADNNAPGSGSLYRLNIPATKKFLRRNTLCGAEAAQWLITYVSGRDLRLAFFSGEKTPLLTVEAMQNTTDLCGTYFYEK